MSTNVSLANPGTSLNFDGQALQNQQEAEIEREEQLQQHELRQLLSNAFDDLDDDILSVGSSEGDSVNVSQASVHQESSRGPFSPVSGQHDETTGERSCSGSLASHTVSAASPAAVSTHSLAIQSVTKPGPPFLDTSAHSGGSKSSAENNQLLSTQRDLFHYTTEQKWNNFGMHYHGQQEVEFNQGEVLNHDSGQLDSIRKYYQYLPHSRSDYARESENQHSDDSSQQPQHGFSNSNENGGFAQYWGDGAGAPPSGNHGGFMFGNQQTASSMPQSSSGTAHNQNSIQYAHVGHMYDTYSQSSGTGHHFHRQHQQTYMYQTHPGEHDVETAGQQDMASKPVHPAGGKSDWERDGESEVGPCAYVPTVYSTQQAWQHLPQQDASDSQHSVWFRYDGGDTSDRQLAGIKFSLPANSCMVDKQSKSEDFQDDYIVQYRKSKPMHGPPKATELDIQHEFVQKESVNEETRQLSQLQILYRSRGRRLEDITAELEKLRLESGKECRMLKHLLSVATGEKEGVELSLKESQKLLQEAKEVQSQVSGKLQATEAQFQAMKEAKGELSKKLQSAETTIENLTHQLAELQEADSLSQARNQHEAVVSSMQQRFDREILTLKEKLDVANETIAEKSKEIASLWKQVGQQTQLAEQAQISRGETINQLTRSLEESQRRCQALLEASSSEEVSTLKAQLQQALVSKTMADNMCTSLQSEVRELKEQLSMLESASSLGALPNSRTPQITAYTDDSMADLGIRRTLDFSTPDSATKFDGSQSSGELISSLRRELECCLVSNKQKRVLVVELQEQKRRLQQQVTEIQEELAATRKVVESQQVKLKNFEERFGDGLKESAVESRLKKDIENLQQEKLTLTQDTDDYKMRLNELSSSEERLTEMNRRLNQQIAEMVHEHDEDKREAMDRCQRTCEDAHKTARENLERSLRSEFFADKQELIMKYEKQLTDTREEMQQVQKELDKVKELYVQASRDLAQQEDKLCSDYQDNQVDLKKLRETLKEKLEAVKEVTEKLETEREQLESQLKEEMRQQAEAQEAELKQRWEKRQKVEVEQAVKATEKEWAEKIRHQAKELERQFAAERTELECKKQRSLETLIQQRLEKEQRSWQVQTDREALEQVDMAVDTARRQWADETRQELMAMKAELEQCSTTHQAELVQLEEKWQHELSEKQTALEKELQTRFQDTLQQEIQQRLAEQKRVLMVEADAKLQQKLTELEATKADEFCRCLKEEKERFTTEMNKKLEMEKRKAVEAACSQWEVSLAEERKKSADSGTQLLLQEVSKWRVEVTRLQGELKAQAAQWEEAWSRLAQEKDEERRRAVASVHAQCEEDYHRFMEDNKATLDSALAAARQEHQQKMEELVAHHKEEIAALRVVEQELRQEIADIKSGANSPNVNVTPGSDQQLAWKVKKLKKEVMQRDELLHQADAHMEQEVQRLRESLAENYTRQREKDGLRIQAQYIQAMHISQKERTRLERQLETVMEELRQEKEHHAEQVEALEARLVVQAEQLEKLEEQGDVEEVLTQLQQVKEENDQVLSELQDSHTIIKRLSDERDSLSTQLEEKDVYLKEERSRLSGRLSECHAAIKALEAERTSLSDKLTNVVQQHKEDLAGVQRKLDQTKARLRQVEAALSAVNKQHREDMQKVTETLTNSHQHELQELHSQIAQMKKQQELMVEEVERKHQAEKQEIMEQVRRQAQRSLAHTPTQTDTDDSLCSLKDQYVNTVNKIKGEVMSHISQSNQRAAITIKTEIHMERQRTIQHLRRRCKSRLRHVFQGKSEGLQGEEIWQIVDAALDSLFDSVSSSLSATPSTSAGVTPRSSEEDAAASDTALNTDCEAMDRKLDDHPVRHQHAGHINTSSSSGGQSVGTFSTPQSVDSERYALPSALGKVELFDHRQSDSSLVELQGSGVFYPLVPDETASVTDALSDTDLDFKQSQPLLKENTDQDFKQSRPLHKENRQLSKLEEPSNKLSKFPVKGGKSATVFTSRSVTKTFAAVPKDLGKAQNDALFSPKMHRAKGWVREVMGVSGESVGWKDVDAGVWTEAVGSTNLWQAYTDLKDMELSDKQPRRQLRFQSQSFLDGYADSDTDSQDGEGTAEALTGKEATAKLQTASPSNRCSALVSKAGDFSCKTKPLTVRYKSMDDLIPESSMEDAAGIPGSLKHSHTTPDLFRDKDRDPLLSCTPHQEKEKTLSPTFPSKLLLNPKNLLSKALQKSDSKGSKPGTGEPETLDSMMARLGFSKGIQNLCASGAADGENDAFLPRDRHSDSFVIDTRKSAFSSKGRKSDSFVQESTTVPKQLTGSTEYSVQKVKYRTHSADNVSHASLHSHHGNGHSRSPGKQLDLHRLLRPEPSKEPDFQRHVSQPHARDHTKHGHRHRSDLDLVQRSLEERQVKEKIHPALSHSGRAKSRSEQALHVLSKALGLEGGSDIGDSMYHYTPLQHLLPPSSPSTSLLSTYSVSEGDLRLTPYQVPGRENEQF